MLDFTKDMLPDLEQFLNIYWYKIIQVDLANDTFKPVFLRENEKPVAGKLSDWIKIYAKNNVDPKDKEKFLKYTSIKNLKGALDGLSVNFDYGRKVGDKYVKSRLIFIPSVKKSTGYIFVKEIELAD